MLSLAADRELSTLEAQQGHTARTAAALHATVRARVGAAVSDAELTEATAEVLARQVESDAIQRLTKLEESALYSMDAAVKLQLESAQAKARDVQDENVRKLVFDDLYADVAEDAKKYQARINFESAQANSALYFKPVGASEAAEPGRDSDDEQEEVETAATGDGDAKKGIFSFLW